MPVKLELAEAVLELVAQDEALTELRQKIDDLKAELDEKSLTANGFRRGMIDMVREEHRLSLCAPGQPLLLLIKGCYYLVSNIYGGYMDLKIQRLQCASDGRGVAPSCVIGAISTGV